MENHEIAPQKSVLTIKCRGATQWLPECIQPISEITKRRWEDPGPPTERLDMDVSVPYSVQSILYKTRWLGNSKKSAFDGGLSLNGEQLSYRNVWRALKWSRYIKKFPDFGSGPRFVPFGIDQDKDVNYRRLPAISFNFPRRLDAESQIAAAFILNWLQCLPNVHVNLETTAATIPGKEPFSFIDTPRRAARPVQLVVKIPGILIGSPSHRLYTRVRIQKLSNQEDVSSMFAWGSNMDLDGFVLWLEWNNKWVHHKVWFNELFSTVEKMDIDAAATFHGGPRPTNISEAQMQIESTMESKINEQRLEEVVVLGDLFKALPWEIRQRILGLAISPVNSIRAADPDGQRSVIFPFPSSYEFGLAHRKWLAHSAPELQMLKVSKQFAVESMEALHWYHTLGFISPRDVQDFLDTFDAHRLSTMSRLELHFDGDVYLKFFQDFLGFTYGRSPQMLWDHCVRYSVTNMFEDIVKKVHVGRFNLTIRYPLVSRMRNSHMRGCCHYELCKWIIKAAVDAVSQFNADAKAGRYSGPTITLTFARGGDDVAQVCEGLNGPLQDRSLGDFRAECEAGKVTWSDLGFDMSSSQVVVEPKRCPCAQWIDTSQSPVRAPDQWNYRFD